LIGSFNLPHSLGRLAIAVWSLATPQLKSDVILRFLQDEVGATAIEYGLIAALIAVGIIFAAQALGTQINATFNSVAANMK
jgi:pilus assembly protein Flp/PilA